MEIQRINDYADPRFPQEVLYQHGAYLADGAPCYFRVISDCEAALSAPPMPREDLEELIEAFRFHAEHITTIYHESGDCLLRLPPAARREVDIDSLQPTQFSVDREKCGAVGHFIHTPADVVIPVIRSPENVLCVADGHTRLYEAWRKGLRTAMVFACGMDPKGREILLQFAREARKRDVFHIRQMALYSPEEQKENWHDWCDRFFAGIEEA